MGALTFAELVAFLASQPQSSPVPVLAPTGRRTVATGGAKSADRRTERNPWRLAPILDPAPKGQRISTVVLGSVEHPSPLRGEKRTIETRFHGFRVGGLRRAAAPPP